ncbi:winged helix DNA-binding domain-containing protein, partial [Peniophora sp. CONT]
KPRYPLSIIIRAAILGSTSGRLTTADIYTAICDKYPYYAALPVEHAWKQTVRHYLSSNDSFVKVARSTHELGRLGYWTV